VILLAIDTCANLCAANVWDAGAGRELGRCVRDIGKGHAEQLLAVIGEALAAAGKVYADLGGIAVAVGPGSFTGIRVGVAAARGLALALDIPSAGVGTLDALAEAAREKFHGRPVVVAHDARRDELYVAACCADGECLLAPRIMRLAEAVELAGQDAPVLAGTAARMVAEAAGQAFAIAAEAPTADIAVYARLAARQGFSGEKPKPLYLRGADARPQEGFALPRKDA
jgi:tRNA threonylcarbamoyl adenosine modification protein YeaZ